VYVDCRVSNCCLPDILALLGYDRVLEKPFGGPGKSWIFFVSKSGNPVLFVVPVGHGPLLYGKGRGFSPYHSPVPIVGSIG